MDRARAIGVTGVPFFVADGCSAVSGAQPAEVLLEVLQEAWTPGPEQRNPWGRLHACR